MNISEIEKLVKQGESSTLEFKKSFSDPDKIGKTISSFVNTDGGIILIGVTDNQKLIGIEITDSLQKSLANLKNHFDPRPDIKFVYTLLPE
jgi:predicted HTH transcriptional regulator